MTVGGRRAISFTMPTAQTSEQNTELGHNESRRSRKNCRDLLPRTHAGLSHAKMATETTNRRLPRSASKLSRANPNKNAQS